MKEKIELQTAKGVRDIPPEELIVRNELVSRMIKVFESYGFNPLETPIVERLDILNAKFGAGEVSDAAKEIFRFKDQGDRDLGLRFELTLSMCRFVAMNPTMKMPFKRYEIGRVYRDGPIKIGRSREFYQCDVDIVGSKRMITDAECIKLSLDVFNELELDAYIEVNNRKLLNGILEYAGVPANLRSSAIIVIDKLNKIGIIGVSEELQEVGLDNIMIRDLVKVISIKGSPNEKFAKIKGMITNNLAQEGIKELEEIFSYFSDAEKEKILFNLTLARGLSYYTGTIFEGFLIKSKVTSSICGGGRYDELIKMLMQGKDDVPAVGISFGLVPIMTAIKAQTTIFKKTVSEIFVIPIGESQKEALDISSKIRKEGINCEIDLMKRNISKNLNYANTKGIPFVLFVGENELKDGKLKLRNMESGTESVVSLKDIGKEVKKKINN